MSQALSSTLAAPAAEQLSIVLDYAPPCLGEIFLTLKLTERRGKGVSPQA